MGFVSEDGVPYGSIDVNELDNIEPKSDEAKAVVEQLKAERDLGQKQNAVEAERRAEQAESQGIPQDAGKDDDDAKAADAKKADDAKKAEQAKQASQSHGTTSKKE